MPENNSNDATHEAPHADLSAADYDQATAPRPVTSAARAADALYSSAKSAIAPVPAPHAAAIDDEVEYTLTIQQTRSLFADHRRKVPAERTLQIYCQEGTIAAKKIRTSFGSEWLVNEPSALAYILKQLEITAAPSDPRAEDAPHATQNTPAATINSAAPTPVRDASVAESPAAPPRRATEATAPAADAAQPIGETRTLAQLLIENSKLLATIDGKEALLTAVVASKDETIAALKEASTFIKDELIDRRKYSSDVKQLAERTLHTLETIATRSGGASRPLPRQNASVMPDGHSDDASLVAQP